MAKAQPVVEKDRTRALEVRQRTLLDRLADVRIRTMEDYRVGERVLHEVKEFYAFVDTLWLDDWNAAKALAKSLKAKLDKAKRPVEDVEERIRGMMGDFLTQEQRKAEAKREREIAKAETKGDVGKATSLAQLPVTNRAVSDDTSARKAWFVVIDDAEKIPDEYWVLDVRRLEAEARALKELFNVPGAHAEWRSTVVVK